jgi:hypothetical protein
MEKFLNKKNLVILGFIILIIVGISLIAHNNIQTVGSGETFKVPTGDKVKVNNQTVNNFYKNPSYLYTQGSVVVEENTNYQIAYIANEGKFIITIFANDSVSKGLAEQAFLRKLGVNESTACKLNTLVQIYTDSNASAPPIISNLSFCK